ncbi:MAG: alpha-amylase family glycosyl hydrolase, partial [Oscillospiraceae bacterium]
MNNTNNAKNWAEQSVFYQIYPMGFFNAPKENDGILVHRMQKMHEWIDYISDMGFNAIYFSPIFESDSHGYDTRDFRKIDCRLGDNDDFKLICKELHEKGIKVTLDGVFNHVGRGFWAFEDVKKNKQGSQFKDWFNIDFNGNSGYNDGFYYEGWEGHYELVKLNLKNGAVVSHIFDCIKQWVEEFDIDGLRLDVAYCLDKDFIKQLKQFVMTLKPDFYLIGECLFGDYNLVMNDEMLNSVTNYECYKGLHSSFNTNNFCEISYSLNRQFGKENWTIYRDKHLLSFVDNHDVSRIASMLAEPKNLPLIYGILFTMPGIPCIYYGSEWGEEALKQNGSDDNLRPSFEKPITNELSTLIKKYVEIKKNSKALNFGSYTNIVASNKQWIFERIFEDERILVAINIDSEPFVFHFDAKKGETLN